MCEPDRLLTLLAAVDEADQPCKPVSSARLATALRWSAEEVAVYLEAARAEMLIWGLRSGRTPKPQFDDVELTVQGQRLLRAHRRQPHRSPAIIDSEATS
jgi:hypothetical protein